MTSLQALRGSEGKIERKVKPIPVRGLLRLKSCELFGIAYAELNLEADAVEIDDLFQASCRCRWRSTGEALRFQPDRPRHVCTGQRNPVLPDTSDMSWHVIS